MDESIGLRKESICIHAYLPDMCTKYIMRLILSLLMCLAYRLIGIELSMTDSAGGNAVVLWAEEVHIDLSAPSENMS